MPADTARPTPPGRHPPPAPAAPTPPGRHNPADTTRPTHRAAAAAFVLTAAGSGLPRRRGGPWPPGPATEGVEPPAAQCGDPGDQEEVAGEQHDAAEAGTLDVGEQRVALLGRPGAVVVRRVRRAGRTDEVRAVQRRRLGQKLGLQVVVVRGADDP